MSQWYVKELSQLTKVSVQTLHHYDRIGLLMPSVRLANGYRLYSEKDLLKLQQIIALKFFGFSLSNIKKMLTTEDQVIHHFSSQAQFLEEKAKHLLEGSQALKSIIADCDQTQSIPWKSIIQLIEVYRMTEALENTWAGKVLSKEELKDYARLQQELKERMSPTENEASVQTWRAIIREVEQHLSQDPFSPAGVAIGKRCMVWVNDRYGKAHLKLRNAVWEKGFKQGNVDSQQGGASPEIIAWLDQAIWAYYRGRLDAITQAVGKRPDNVLLNEWQALLTDMYGDEKTLKEDFLQAVLKDEKTSAIAKEWLKQKA